MQHILIENNKGIVTLTLNKPKVLNTLCVDLMSEVLETLEGLSADENTKALVITGSGRAFCAGADLGAGHLAESSKNGVPLGDVVASLMEDYFNPMMEAIYTFPRPVVMAVNGIAAGGGVGLALCADIVIASDNAGFKVVQPQQLGIVADLGANWLLSRLVGRSRAMAMCMTGDTVSAADFKEWGGVWSCVTAEQLLPSAIKIAEKLAAIPTATVLGTRQLVDDAPTSTFTQSLHDEKEAQRLLCSDPIFIESVMKFFASK